MKYFKFLSVFSSCFIVSGCGWLWGSNGYIHDRSYDYLQAEESAPMSIIDVDNTYEIESLLEVPVTVDKANSIINISPPEILPVTTDTSSANQNNNSELTINPRLITVQRGEPALLLNSTLDNAWVLVENALLNSDITIIEKNKQLEVYLIDFQTYAINKKENGVFNELIDEKESFKKGEFDLQVRLTVIGSQVQITVEKNIDSYASKNIASSILNDIKDNI